MAFGDAKLENGGSDVPLLLVSLCLDWVSILPVSGGRSLRKHQNILL